MNEDAALQTIEELQKEVLGLKIANIQMEIRLMEAHAAAASARKETLQFKLRAMGGDNA